MKPERATIAIRACGLGKSYGMQWALRGVDLEVEEGEAVALFGSNGAGKSTLLRLLATLTPPSIGILQVLGVDTARGAALVRGSIGVVNEKSYLYSELTAAENLELYASLYSVKWSAEHTGRALGAVGLSGVASKRVREFSRGMLQRLALARATLHEPALLLLDEPDSGLDTGGIACLQQLIAAGRERGQAVVLATHNLELGLDLCGRAIVLERGRAVYSAPTGSHSLAEWRELYKTGGNVRATNVTNVGGADGIDGEVSEVSEVGESGSDERDGGEAL